MEREWPVIADSSEMATLDAVLRALKKCQRTLRQLEAGQQLSQRAGSTFTELAADVERVLEERRNGSDRRKRPRCTPDRRRTSRRAG